MGSEGRVRSFGPGSIKSSSGAIVVVGTTVWIDVVEESVSVDVSVVSSWMSSFTVDDGKVGNFANRAFRKSPGCSITIHKIDRRLQVTTFEAMPYEAHKGKRINYCCFFTCSSSESSFIAT